MEEGTVLNLLVVLPSETSQAIMGLQMESKFSIESEPLTLTFDQLKYAREAALYVLNTKTLDEAISIFTEGLQPVSTRGKKKSSLDDDGEELDRLSIDHLSLPCMRDIVTAPF